jgi:hypothetical protein|tara:strand:- start:118 stop:327 length:210 start_codon:yes stop_codon:yes gene_type:complete
MKTNRDQTQWWKIKWISEEFNVPLSSLRKQKQRGVGLGALAKPIGGEDENCRGTLRININDARNYMERL